LFKLQNNKRLTYFFVDTVYAMSAKQLQRHGAYLHKITSSR